MSKKPLDGNTESGSDLSDWILLLEETRAEILANPDLSDEDKRRLEELDGLSELEWQPVRCFGKPVSQTIIEDRGER